MTNIRDFFKKKYDRNSPAYLQGVLRTLGVLPHEDEESVPTNKEGEVYEK